MTKPPKPVELLDQEFRHWHVLGPLLWGGVAYIGAVALHELQVPTWYVLAVGSGVSLLAPLVAVYKRFAFFLMAATTALLIWTTVTTPLARNPALAALAGSVLFGVGYQALRTRETKQDADKTATKAAEKGRYVELLETIGIVGMKEKSRKPFSAGKTLTLLLPISGKITLSRLKDATEALEIAAARAGITATFEFERGKTAAEILLHVFDRDILAEEIPYPFDRGPKSIHEPIPLGQFPTGEVCVITFREVAALMVGLKGKGKSGLINTHLAHLTGCTDAVVWMLDGKNGETVRPWLEPFLNMVTARPAIDWPAIDVAEFDAVLLATKYAREYRTANGWSVKTESRSSPAIIVIVEEASVITGVARYGAAGRVELAQDAVTLGRSSDLSILLATQRAVLDMLGSGSMKSNMDVRYGLGVTEAQDARMIFPDGQMAKSLYRLGDDPIYRGTFLMQAPGVARVMPAKGYWIEPSTIPGIAETNTVWAAELDRGTADAVHAGLTAMGVAGGYYGRWDRIRASLGVPSQRPTDTPVAETSRPLSQPGPASQVVQDRIKASRAKRDDDTFQALVSASFETVELGDDGTFLRDVSTVPDSAPPVLRLTLAVFKGRGNPETLPSRVICEELPGEITAKALGRLMALCNVAGGEVVWDGKRARGYTRDDIETSVKRGSWTQGAFDWTP